jgi:SAM-dependent methyltransferase
MDNPWLSVDLTDYINHMNSPEIGQYQMINESFRTVLEKFTPKNIFVPGCTIGNGFEYINWKKIEKVTAIDVNSDFLKVLRERFPDEDRLEIIAGDFNLMTFNNRKYDLIFSALFFEYVDIKSALYKFREMMNDTSILFSIIQLPDPGQSKVSKSKYKSLEKLGPHITLISTEEFSKEINQAELKIIKSTEITLANGKSFLLTESVKNNI